MICALLCTSCASRKEYSSGRDTVKSYGNGEYQLLKDSYSLTLVNQKYESCLMNDVEIYENKNNILYVLGTHYNIPVWIKTDIKTGRSEYYILQDGVTVDDLYIFNKNIMKESGNFLFITSTDTLSEQNEKILEEMKKRIIQD